MVKRCKWRPLWNCWLFKEKSGKVIAYEIYTRIIDHVESIDSFPESGRVIPELLTIGIRDLREWIEKPWRIFYWVKSDEI